MINSHIGHIEKTLATQCLIFIYAFVTIAMLLIVFAPKVNAEPGVSSTTDKLVAYCKDKLPKKFDSVCGSVVIKKYAFNVAQQNCTDKSSSNNSLYNCILNTAEGYIDTAASKYRNASDANDFYNKFTNFLNTKGDITKGTIQANTGGSAQTFCPSGSCEDPAIQCSNDNCDFVAKYVNPAINLLTAVFGLIAVISLILGGIQYTSSGGDSQKVSQAKQRIANTIVAIVAYFFLYGFLQFLIPGGVFNR